MNISICIVSHNQAHYLPEAVESALAQTAPPHEIIIVDDASTDASPDLIARYARQYPDLVRPHYHAANRGVAAARNTALNMVSGDYVTFLDSDDHFLPEKLERESAVFRARAPVHLVFSNYYITDAHGQRQRTWIEPGERPPEGDIFLPVFTRDLPRADWFRSELVEYAVWQRVGFFDPALAIYEDYEMRTRLAKVARAAYCDTPLSAYRKHPAGLSQRHPPQHFAAYDYIVRKNRPLLADLPAAQRRAAEARLRDLLAGWAKRAAYWELHHGSRRAGLRAIGYALRHRVTGDSLRLLVRLLVPFDLPTLRPSARR